MESQREFVFNQCRTNVPFSWAFSLIEVKSKFFSGPVGNCQGTFLILIKVLSYLQVTENWATEEKHLI